jgi:hypothetical protein
VAIFLEIFQKVPLTMLLGGFFVVANGEFTTKKSLLQIIPPG